MNSNYKDYWHKKLPQRLFKNNDVFFQWQSANIFPALDDSCLIPDFIWQKLNKYDEVNYQTKTKTYQSSVMAINDFLDKILRKYTNFDEQTN